MEKVASHINEMQKIYEDYGTVFDQLVAEQSGTEKEVCGGFGLSEQLHAWVDELRAAPSRAATWLDFPGADKAAFALKI